MVQITVQEGAGETSVRSFLDTEWVTLDPELWTGGRCIIRAERGDELLGVAVCSLSAGVAHLSELMVKAKERNRGIGAQVLAAFEEWAATHRAHKLMLNTRRDGPAQRFYERHGWQVAHILEKHYLRTDYVIMVKWPST